MQNKIMVKKVALLIIYNHRYDKNIPLLEKIYGGRFTHLYHIIPYYDGTKDNVLTVYDSSFYFESYIAQAYQQIKDKGFSHFFFIADDMILNPEINENSLFEFTGIPEDYCWINDFRDYKSHPYSVPVCTPIYKKGIEVYKQLPSVKDVCSSFDAKGLCYFPSRVYAVKDLLYNIVRKWASFCYKDLIYLFHYRKKSFYPGVWGYSDIVLVPSEFIEKFVLYCGAFAGLNIFVEHAIPLALLMSSNKIMVQNDIMLKTVTQLYGLGDEGQKEFEDKYQFSLEKLINEFPKDWFFVHPIKLSKWK